MVEEDSPPDRDEADKIIREGYCFMKKMRRPTPTTVHKMYKRYPDFSTAYDLHASPGTTSWIVEAALLSDATIEQIAEYVGQPVRVIKIYGDVFYNVKHRLNNRGYILNQIMFPAMHTGMHGRDFDFLYKVLGYCAGWDALREFIEAHEMDPNVEAWLTGSFNSRVKKLAWIAAHRLEVNQYNALEVMTKGIELQTLEHEAGGTVAQQQGIEAMKALLQHCKMAIMPPDTMPLLSEPRFQEQLNGVKMLHYGDEIPLKGV
jgi:hypothetical protein